MPSMNLIVRIFSLVIIIGGIIGTIFSNSYLFLIMIVFGVIIFIVSLLISFDNIAHRTIREDEREKIKKREKEIEIKFLKLYEEELPLNLIIEQLDISVFDIAPIIRNLSNAGKIFIGKKVEIIDPSTGDTLIVTPSGIGWIIKSKQTKDIELGLKGFTNVELIEVKENTICQICKLTIKKNTEIVTCSSCSSFFHKNHLIQWLKTNSYCPVCKEG